MEQKWKWKRKRGVPVCISNTCGEEFRVKSAVMLAKLAKSINSSSRKTKREREREREELRATD